MVSVIRKLAGMSWRAGTSSLRNSPLALVYPTAEYCAPVWVGSSPSKRLATMLNCAMRFISRILKSTPLLELPVPTNTTTPDIRKQTQTFENTYR